jgi:hypothetical protein
MFDRYVIVEDSLRQVRNPRASAEIVGFAVDVRIAYYRGLGLSMVEPFTVVVDGVDYPPTDVAFTVHGNTYTAEQMENEVDDRWEMAEAATLTVQRPGGLAGGEHDVTVVEHLRISYVPTVVEARCEKTLASAVAP